MIKWFKNSIKIYTWFWSWLVVMIVVTIFVNIVLIYFNKLSAEIEILKMQTSYITVTPTPIITQTPKPTQTKTNNINTQKYKYVDTCLITFYSMSEDETDATPEIGAYGKVKPWVTVAANPPYFSAGDKVKIEGYGVFTVMDVTATRTPYHIDILVNSKEQAKKLGVKRRVKVWKAES